MELTLLIQSFLGLVILLGLLIAILILPQRLNKKKNKEANKEPNTQLQDKKHNVFDDTLEKLRDIIKKNSTSKEELQESLELVIKYHGTIPHKLGIRTSPDSDIYMDILFKACRHKNASSEMIVKFSRDLEKLNEEYKKEINDALMRGLNSRGI